MIGPACTQPGVQLTATAHGLATSLMSQPIDVPAACLRRPADRLPDAPAPQRPARPPATAATPVIYGKRDINQRAALGCGLWINSAEWSWARRDEHC